VGEAPLEKVSPPLEKCVGYSLKILDIVQKIWAPLRKLFTPPGVPSWLRACLKLWVAKCNFGVAKQISDIQLFVNFARKLEVACSEYISTPFLGAAPCFMMSAVH